MTTEREKRVPAIELFAKPPTQAQKRELRGLVDSDIDFSDAPEVVRPGRVIVGRFYLQIK